MLCATDRSVRLAKWLLPASALPVLAMAGGAGAQTPPTGGAVQAGIAAIATSGDSLTVTQDSARAIVTWDGFSIGAANQVRFENGTGATLNRVTGAAVSAIDGRLSASGSVYLVNPNGVIIGGSGVVDVGGSFVAATLDADTAGFLAGGDLAFTGGGSAAVVNLGKIGALGSQVALIAARVENSGSIAAPNGSVGLLAGSDVLLRDQALDDGKFLVRVGASGTSVANGGTIAAAMAELRANGGNVYALAGNVAGVIRATGVTSRDGRLFLTAGDTGTVTLAGDLAARGASGAAGRIATGGGTVALGTATVDAGQGGRWLLADNGFTIDRASANVIAASSAAAPASP